MSQLMVMHKFFACSWDHKPMSRVRKKIDASFLAKEYEERNICTIENSSSDQTYYHETQLKFNIN